MQLQPNQPNTQQANIFSLEQQAPLSKNYARQQPGQNLPINYISKFEDQEKQQNLPFPQPVYEHYSEGEYYDNQIPPNWEIAKLHGMSRQVGPVILNQQMYQHCPCCGWQVQRKKLDFCCDAEELQFLGSAFPSYYNWLMYVIISLFLLLGVSSIYEIAKNFNGANCTKDIHWQDLKTLTADEVTQIKQYHCQVHLFNALSIFNRQLTGLSHLRTGEYLALASFVAIGLIIFVIRFTQNGIDCDCDSKNDTPADYTIQAWNIPTNLSTNYEEELRFIFTNCAAPGQVLNVTKIVLVFSRSYLNEIEKKIADALQQKQAFLRKNGYREIDPQYKDLTFEIDNLEKRLRMLRKEIREDPGRFSGTAFISYSTEAEKQLVLDTNKSSMWE